MSQNVKEQYAPGLWLDNDDVFHVDPGPYLKHCGVADTQENRDKVIEMAKEIIRDTCAQMGAHPPLVIDQFDRDPIP